MEEKRRKTSYEDAGVDIDGANTTLAKMKGLISSTFTPHVLSGIGHFGTLFDLTKLEMDSPVLVSSADGVGTKLKIAFMADRHDTVGMDIVNHCTNDILVQGATPLFFLDYIACGKFKPRVFEELVQGLAHACKDNDMALIGGETAEMPGFYSEDEYDLVGFIVGAVDKSRLVDGSSIKVGDVLIGLRSSGLHTNGYSLVRKILLESGEMRLEDRPEVLDCSLGEELLKPHRSYLKAVRSVEKVCGIRGMAHITGGGLTDNIPRILPQGTSVRIRFGSWPVPPIFRLVMNLGGVSVEEALRVFNMGVGLTIAVEEESVEKVGHTLKDAGFEHDVIGEVVEGDRTVQYEGI